MDANQWRRYDASSRRDAVRGVVERSYVGDHRRRARTQRGTSSCHHDIGVHGPSGAEYGRPAQKRPRGSGDLPQPVQFVSAAGSGAVSSRDPENSHKSGSCDPAWQATAPPKAGSLAANTVVANMMKRMNYKEGSGLGKHGQGITAPIELALRPKNAGLGTVEGSISWGADEPSPGADNWPKWDDAGGAKKRFRDFTGPERDDAVRAQKHDLEELDEEILARPLDKGSATEAVVRVQNALARAAPGGGCEGNLCYGEEMAEIITNTMKWVQEESASGTLTAAELIRKFKDLKERYPREYATFGVADAVRAIVAPLLRSLFLQWEPLKDPSRGLNAVNMLRDVLLDDGLVNM